MKQLLLTLSILAISTLGLQAGDAESISLTDLKGAIAAKEVVVIDVNGSASYASGHIPTAIDFEANKADLAAVLPADKSTLIVAYCGNEYCGAHAMATKAAKELGYTNVKHFSPGIAGWKKAGEPTESKS